MRDGPTTGLGITGLDKLELFEFQPLDTEKSTRQQSQPLVLAADLNFSTESIGQNPAGEDQKVGR